MKLTKTIIATMLTCFLFLSACSSESDEKADIKVSKISLFQVIEIPLFSNSKIISVNDRNAPIVADRAAKVVTYIDVPSNWKKQKLEVQVEVLNKDIKNVYSSEMVIEKDSVLDKPKTGIEVDVPKDALQEGATLNVMIKDTTQKEMSFRFPNEENIEIGAVHTGPMNIHLVPYEVNGYVPDVSKDVIEGYREAVFALYPTSNVNITVGDVRKFNSNNVGDVIVDVGIVQEKSKMPKNVFFYGLVSGVEKREDFKGSTGTSEAGGTGTPNRAYFACGAAFGDSLSESTLAHELGHLLTLMHSPTGNPPDVDPDFPNKDGKTEVVGYDYRTEEYIEANAFDLMGYTQPRWISAYSYTKLANALIASQKWSK
ncbi:MAG: ImmA/IrrE family metallo-endopeptidase [Bacilli bacterium]